MDILEERILAAAYYLTSLGLGTARAINDRGAIVGAQNDKPFLWGQEQNHFLSARDGISMGINDKMQIAGELRLSPFIYDSDTQLLEGQGAANAINNEGVAVGTSMLGDVSVPTVWQPEQVQLSQREGTVHGINDAGDAVGELGGDAVLWGRQGSHDLFMGVAHDINESGTIVGESGGRATIVSAGVVADMGGPLCRPDYTVTFGEAVGINDVGQIVGNFTCTNLSNGRHHPYPAMWEAGAWTPLINLIYGYVGFALPTTVHDINNDGSMVGDSRYPFEAANAFLMFVYGYMDSATGEKIARQAAWWRNV